MNSSEQQTLVIEQAYAKINLILAVTGKRIDGYHDLQTVFQSLALHDTLTFTANESEVLTLTTNNPSLPAGPDNLIWRAAERLMEFYKVKKGVAINLEKRIPLAAGLGGGSSDAAATLRGLVRFWQLPCEPQVLSEIAAELGSDVPYCLAGGTALGTGRGEQLLQLTPCPHFYVVLANPGFPVSTAQVYQDLRTTELASSAALHGMLRALAEQNQTAMMHHVANTLEKATFRLYPQVKALKTEMASASAALMCGSGPTVFALFLTSAAATAVQAALQQKGYQVWLTETIQQPEVEKWSM
ncbi:MAG TPA: 4-(cytidine 5'-diphospho)-2-C-methyl-D-erythritol kinase [Oscillospiraceae bacterium]|nr:4-(cytidine 5'-diphospho)-2-C-methyl-D-erythritol kinase [Oscillospiraceae bacterium]